MFRKLTMGVTSVLVLLAIIGGATVPQMIPFVVFYVLAYFYDKEEREEDLLKPNHKLNFWIVFLALVMAILNFGLALNTPSAFIDVIVWVLIIFAWWK